MDKKQIDIQKSLKKLFIKMLVLDFLMLGILLIASVLYTAYFKQRLAEQLSDSFRTSLINGDNRQILLDMSSPVLKDFLGVKWMTQTGGNNFSIPENFPETNILFSGVSKVNIFFDEEKKFKYGELRFYYHKWAYSHLALILWIPLFLLSLKLTAMEKSRLVKEYSLLIDYEINKSLADLSAQLAHDIRSPLAALDSAVNGLQVPGERRELINSAVFRIHAIADDLLKKYKKRMPEDGVLENFSSEVLETGRKAVPCDIAKIVESVLLEKKSQYPCIIFTFEKPERAILIQIETEEFARVISNLLNNSVESIEDCGNGMVEISLKTKDEKAILSIKDNGKGIAKEVIGRVGQKGFTYGKEGGNGLGLWHARSFIERANGRLEIKSEIKKGTEIIIVFPLPVSMPFFSGSVVLIDDDALVRKNWEAAARRKNINLKTFSAPEDFIKTVSKYETDVAIYIDSELEAGVNGEEIARELYKMGFKNIRLETGHDKDKFKNIPFLRGITGKEPPF